MTQSQPPPLVAFLVEDNELIRENLIMAMADVAGTRVVAFAETEKDAAVWLVHHAGDWQIAVVDMFLREGSGMGVLGHLASRSPSQRAVVLTNYATSAIRQKCAELGADMVFDKSTELDDFLTYCDSTINGGRP